MVKNHRFLSLLGNGDANIIISFLPRQKEEKNKQLTKIYTTSASELHRYYNQDLSCVVDLSCI